MRPSLLGGFALRYATEQGLAIFPVDPIDKTPLVSQYTATTDGDQIVRWWARWPNALIGHHIDVENLILDIDPRHGGHTTWAKLEESLGPIGGGRRHHSGRGDDGHHDWYTRPGGRLSIKDLNTWAQEHGVGQPTGEHGKRWTAGIDLLHSGYRYTILPPSPHPDTGDPYGWDRNEPIGPLHPFIADLIVREDVERDEDDQHDEHAEVGPRERVQVVEQGAAGSLSLQEIEHSDSIADWFSDSQTWSSILEPHGWTLVQGKGDADGSLWRHPEATSPHSASTRHGCLFVYSSSTDFEESEEGDPHGYTRFRAFALLDHDGELSAAAGAARALKDAGQAAATEGAAPESGDDGMVRLIDWTTPNDVGDDLVDGLVIPGRWTQFVAAAKTGKSTLLVSMSLELSEGRDPFDGTPTTPVTVLWVNGEMGRDDLDELISACGHVPAQLTRWHSTDEHLRLDTADGALRLLKRVDHIGAQLVIVDGLNGVVNPDASENDDTTWRPFYAHTIVPLKRRNVAVASADNMGKDASKGSRGSSVKTDKADGVINVSRLERGVKLHATHARGGRFVDTLALNAVGLDRSQPIRYSSTAQQWPPGTRHALDLLAELAVPLDEGRDKVRARLRSLRDAAAATGTDSTRFEVSTDALRVALRHRRTSPLNVAAGAQVRSQVRS